MQMDWDDPFLAGIHGGDDQSVDDRAAAEQNNSGFGKIESMQTAEFKVRPTT